VGTPQVRIEAKFVEVTMTDISELGIEWYWYEEGNIGNASAFSSYPPGYGTSSEGITWGQLDGSGNYEAFPQEGHGFDFYIGSADTSTSYLRAYLHALEEKGKANLLSAPKVMTLSGQMANMQVTKTFPYVSDVELENVGTAEDPTWVLNQTYEEATTGITLEVTPHVSARSSLITLDLHPVVDVLVAQRSIKPNVASGSNLPTVPAAVGWPVIDTRSTQTSIITKSGETIVLGGFIKEEENVTTRKVPFLGDVPLLGNLFKYKHVNREKKNLLIFITATLIDSDGKENK
jgi:type II secretory pathway component GspD/PulD (secretin)